MYHPHVIIECNLSRPGIYKNKKNNQYTNKVKMSPGITKRDVKILPIYADILND